MTAAPPISVIVPCFNAAPFIAATLRSVMAQQGIPLQVIVVDDGSTDGSDAIVERTFPEVTLLRQANGGVAAARNAGLRAAMHDWVAFIDADDLWLPGKLTAQWQALQSAPQARVAYTAWQVWTSDDPEPDAAWMADLMQNAHDARRWQGASGWIYPELLVDCVVWTSTVLAERALLTGLGGFREDLRIGEDWDLWLRVSRESAIVRVSCPYALYRLHPSSITKGPPKTNFKHQVVSSALSRWGLSGPDGRQASIGAVRRSQARTWADIAGSRLMQGDFARARRDAVQAVRNDPGSALGWTILAKAVARGLVRR